MLFTAGKFLLGQGVKRPGRTADLLMKGADLVGTGYLLSGIPGLNKTWTQEAIDGKELEDYAKGPDGKRDVSSIKSDLGWKNYIPGLAPTNDQILSALKKQEQEQIAKQRSEVLAANPMLAPHLGGRVEGETSEDFDTRVATAADAYKKEQFKTKLENNEAETLATYYSKPAVEERRLAAEMRNDTLLREAQIRADATNARQESNLLTLQLAQMNDRANHRREKAAARSQLVAALVGSLDNLGSAFVSI